MTLLINPIWGEFKVRKFNICVTKIAKKGLNQLRHLWLLIIVITYLPNSLQGNENTAVDNLTIFDRLIEQITQRAVDHVDLKPDSKIFIKNIESKDANGWFLENWFIKNLNKLNCDSVFLYRTGLSRDTSIFRESDSVTIFEFKIINLNVEYKGEKKFWKFRSVERRILIKLWLNIYTYPDGLVYWTDVLREEYSDKIKMNQIPSIQNKAISFTQATIPYPGFKKVLEPIFIMGLTGVVIYLFYSFRSK